MLREEPYAAQDRPREESRPFAPISWGQVDRISSLFDIIYLRD
jgi:hypothetical protein